MKSSTKKLLIWLAVAMVVSLGIAAIILVTTGNFVVATEEINESKTFDLGEISGIDVNLVSTDLNIIPTTKGEIIVHFYGEVSTTIKWDVPELIAYKTGDRLYVETQRSKNIIVFGVNIERMTMDIYIPGTILDELNINLISGDVIVEGTNAAQLVLKTVSGDIKIQGLDAEKTRTSSTSGDISIRDYTGNMDAGTISGDISMIGGKDNEDIYASSVSGDIYIEQDKVSQMKIESTSGDVRVVLPEESTFYLDVNTISGDIKQDFPLKVISSGRRELEGSVGDGSERIMINTISGDVTIDH